jgi:hypothetical protein
MFTWIPIIFLLLLRGSRPTMLNILNFYLYTFLIKEDQELNLKLATNINNS